MRVKIFTLKFDEIIGKIDDGELQNFIGDKQLIDVKEHFFIKDNLPYGIRHNTL